MKIYILCLLALTIAQQDLWQPETQLSDSEQISYDFDGNIIENQVNIETNENSIMDEYQTNSDVQIVEDTIGVQAVQETQDVFIDNNINVNDQTSDNLDGQGVSFEMQEQQEYKLTLEEHPISENQGEVLQEIDTQLDIQDIDSQKQEIQSDNQEGDTQEELQSSSPVEIVQDSDIEVIDDTVSYQAATLELPIESANIVDNEGNMVDSVEGLATYLSIDKAEVNDAPADRVLEFRSDDCIVIFAQCNYKGDQMEVCDSLSSVQNFEHQIQSIFIPEGQSLTVYDQENYSGEKIKYTTSQSCLFKPVSFAHIMRSSKVILLTINNNLRGK